MEALRNIINTLPQSPGVYQFIDKKGGVIYVGKAKNLRKRVTSYFTGENTKSFKIKTLVNQIIDIKHIIVESESDALFLENNLIKRLQPRYNVLLKDDKTFPWICIKNESFPRIFSTRRFIRDGSEYYGPYTSAFMVKTLLSLIRELYPLRTCSFILSKENIKNGKYKKCLEYHIGNCKAPCENLQSDKDYENSINQIRNILKGNIQEVIGYLEKTMLDFSNTYQFENAEKIRQKILLLERYKSKSTIVNPKLNNVDVYSYIKKESYAVVNFLKIINGAIIQSHTVELKNRLDDTKESLFTYAILDIREKVKSSAKEIIVPFYQVQEIAGIKFIVPKAGDKKKLLDLSERNARQYLLQKEKIFEQKSFLTKTQSILEQVKKDLQLKEIPSRIECFDNSNIQGTNPVASCVVFIDAKPAKKEYRHYNIKSVTGSNDYASMEEVIFRRYKRVIEEKKELPQLIVIDGGKGQLSSAVKSLKNLDLYGSLPVIGIAKRLEEIYFPNDSIPIYLDKNSSALKLIQRLRNEAHRFGISFHRSKRSKDLLQNQLEQIRGVGQRSAEKLLKKFGSLENIRSKSKTEIKEIVGNKIAERVFEELHKI